jgi:hypothetical protein
MCITDAYYPENEECDQTFKLPQALAEALAKKARNEGVNESELIRDGIRHVTGAGDAGLDMEALIGEETGVGSGPVDLSSNREHMRGYGRARNR